MFVNTTISGLIKKLVSAYHDMVIRRSYAMWEGSVKNGEGRMATGSGAFEGRYSFMSRFGIAEPPQTNPEELLGAAHAGCFSMSLANVLVAAGHEENRVYTDADVTLENVNGRHRISRIGLQTDAYVPSIQDEAFLDCVETAKEQCLVSEALSAVDIDIVVERVDEWMHY